MKTRWNCIIDFFFYSLSLRENNTYFHYVSVYAYIYRV